MIIGKNLGFDLEQSRALCTQLNQYKEKNHHLIFHLDMNLKKQLIGGM